MSEGMRSEESYLDEYIERSKARHKKLHDESEAMLARVKAKAWDEGYDAGGYLGESISSNPYRTEQA